eukprot:6351004-Alexandrium_andersonii.AAC.1
MQQRLFMHCPGLCCQAVRGPGVACSGQWALASRPLAAVLSQSTVACMATECNVWLSSVETDRHRLRDHGVRTSFAWSQASATES